MAASQHELAGVAARVPCTRLTVTAPSSKRLAQHLQGVAVKIRAARPETARRCVPGSPHRGAGSTPPPAMAGGAYRCGAALRKGRCFTSPLPRRQQPGHRVDGAGLQRLLIGQRRQNARQALGQHGFYPCPAGRSAISCARRRRRSPARGGLRPGRAHRPYRGQARYPLRQSRRGRPG